MGQDVEAATRLAQESIDKARRQIEEQRIEMDQTLGTLDELHHSGPNMPKLDRQAPPVPVRDFVLRAMRAEGSVVLEKPSNVFEVRVPGRPPEVVTFDEKTAEALATQAVFMGKVRLYQPGKPEFERLVQHWVDRCGQIVCDLRGLTDSTSERLARSWCETVPDARFLGCEVLGRKAKFQGRAQVKVKASNGVDGYEKLISRKFHPEGHTIIQPTTNPADLLLEKALPSEMLQDYAPLLAQAVEADRDVAEFCRFYEERRTAELVRAADDPRLRHKVSEDFTPIVIADIVGFHGVRYDEVRLQVRFSLQGEGCYEAIIRTVPVAAQVLEEPVEGILLLDESPTTKRSEARLLFDTKHRRRFTPQR